MLNSLFYSIIVLFCVHVALPEPGTATKEESRRKKTAAAATMNISMSNSFEHVAYINFYIFTLRRNRRQSLLHDSKCLFSLIFFPS